MLLTACDTQQSDTASFSVSNDTNQLEQRYTATDREIPIDTTVAGASKAKWQHRKPKFSLTQVAELVQPDIDGQEVQATMVSIHASSAKAVVSYNRKGSDYLGAIDVLKVTSGNAKTMRIQSGIEFFNADANAVYTDGDQIWSALATDDPDYTSEGNRSSLQSFGLNGFTLSEEQTQIQSVPSFAANSVTAYGDYIYATSGSTGGLSIFEQGDLNSQVDFISIEEARWVDVSSEYLVVLQADLDADQQGKLLVFDTDNFSEIGQYDFPGAYTPEAKNTVEIVGQLAFIAAGKEGVQIMDLTNGQIVADIPRPDPQEVGLPDDRVATNAVSVDEDKIFISNGEAGVYVAEGGDRFDRYRSGDKLSVDLIGKLQFDEAQSVNHVAYRSHMLVIAAGSGGAKIIRLK
jgi:hypothetical protein